MLMALELKNFSGKENISYQNKIKWKQYIKNKFEMSMWTSSLKTCYLLSSTEIA